MKERIVRTVCRMCQAGCGIQVHVEDGRIVKVCGLAEDPRTRGALCPKGFAAAQLVHSPDRLQYPLKRVGERGAGKWQRITWDEALHFIASRLKEIKGSDGAEAISVFKGQAPDWGDSFQYPQRFMNLLGSPNLCTPGSVCHYPRVLAAAFTYGVKTSPDYQNARCIVLWATNPTGANEGGLRIGHIIDARERGAKLIVVNPILTDLAAKADIWVRIRPGTDCALALGMLNVIINENLYDREFVDTWTFGFDQLKRHVQQYLPKTVSNITGLEAKTIQEMLRTYAEHRPACLYDGNAIDQRVNSVQTARAICILRAVTGNLDVLGGDLLPDTLNFGDLRLAERMPKAVKPAGDYPLMFQHRQLPLLSVIDAILTEKPYPVKAMIVQGGNPAVVMAKSDGTREALAKLDLLAVMDLFMTRTAQLADVVLPAASSFERAGLTAYPAMRSNFVLVQQKAIEPVGESWPDWRFWFELGKRMGYREEFLWEDVEETIDELLAPSGMTFAKLKEKPVVLPRQYKKFEKKGFPSMTSGKVELYADALSKWGYQPLPSYVEPPESPVSTPELLANYPLTAICWPRSVYVHSQHRNLPWLREIDPEPLVRVHPDDADQRAIRDGDEVVARSPRGSIRLKARITRRVPPRVVAFTWGWGESVPEANLNTLTDSLSRDPITGSTANNLFLCEVQKA
jgi:anaerobic selenocysteine-containing dehydrogenase